MVTRFERVWQRVSDMYCKRTACRPHSKQVEAAVEALCDEVGDATEDVRQELMTACYNLENEVRQLRQRVEALEEKKP